MAMSHSSQTLLPYTGDAFEITGEPCDVTGYHRFTVAIHTANLTGKVVIEASVENTPSDGDWFAVASSTFPRPDHPHHMDAVAHSFRGSYTFVRVRLDRDNFLVRTNAGSMFGCIDRVLLNFT